MQLLYFPPPPLAPCLPTSHRSAIRSRLSTFFHGQSIVGHGPIASSSHTRKIARLRLEQSSRNRDYTAYLNAGTPGLRSPTSTRSLIDPASSSTYTTSPVPSETFGHFPPYDHGARLAYPPSIYPVAGTERRDLTVSDVYAQRPETRWRQRPRKRLLRYLPQKIERTVRKKIISSIVFGGILAAILSTYLALALTNTITTQKFQVPLILLILTAAVFFCHSLIRLCMIALHSSPPAPAPSLSSCAIEDDFAQPPQPIRIILARDEELGLCGEELDEEKVMPKPPPPAYGVWRCSVRMDPNLVHWQRSQLPTQGEALRRAH